MRSTSLCCTPPDGCAVLRGRPAGVPIRIAHGCAGAAKHRDVPVRRFEERPPGELVERSTAWGLQSGGRAWAHQPKKTRHARASGHLVKAVSFWPLVGLRPPGGDEICARAIVGHIPAGVPIRIAHGCAGAAKHRDVPVRRFEERPPGELVERSTAWGLQSGGRAWAHQPKKTRHARASGHLVKAVSFWPLVGLRPPGGAKNSA